MIGCSATDGWTETLRSSGWRVSFVHVARLLCELRSSLVPRSGADAAELRGPTTSSLIQSDIAVVSPSSLPGGLNSASASEIAALCELLRDKGECGGAWVIITSGRSPFWAKAEPQLGLHPPLTAIAECAFWSAARHTWQVASSIPEFVQLRSRCAHVHHPGSSGGDLGTPSTRTLIAMASIMNKWAEMRFLNVLQHVATPPPESTGQRHVGLVGDGTSIAMSVQFGLRVVVDGIAVPWRSPVMHASHNAGVVFIGWGSPEVRERRSTWSSPFLVERDGEHHECARWYAERLLMDESLLRRTAELAGQGLVCECAIGFHCHSEALALASLGMTLGGIPKARELLVQLCRNAGHGTVPSRPNQRWPQEGIQQALRGILPPLLVDAHIPFIEDIINAPPFTSFLDWLDECGEPSWTMQGPSWNYIRKPAWQRVAEGRQDGAFSSKKAVSQVVSYGLEKYEHLERAIASAKERGFPLDDSLGFDKDVRFAAFATVQNRSTLRKFRQGNVVAVNHLARRLHPLAEQLKQLQPPTVRSVAGDMNLALVAVLLIILQWPDIDLVKDYVRGFNVIGEVQASGVYPINPRQEGRVAGDLLEGAKEYVDEITKSLRKTRDSEFLVAECLKDEERHMGDRLRTLQEMNERWGEGQWRPLPRFLVVQGNGKKRACDDGLRAGHNEATVVLDKLVLCSASQPGICAKALLAAATSIGADLAAENILVESGTDDLPDAYRHVPVDPEQLNMHVVAVYDEPSRTAYFSRLL